MFWMVLIHMATANRLAYTESVGTAILDVVQSQNGRKVALLESGSSAVLELSTLDWAYESWAPCTGVGGIVYVENKLYAGCADGQIKVFGNQSSEAGNDLSIDGGAVLSLNHKDGVLYVLAENPNGGNPRVHALELANGTERSGGYPSTLGYSAFEDADIVGNFLIVTQSGNAVSKVDLASGGATRNNNQGPTAVKLGDVLPESNASNALIAAGTGGLIRFLLATNDTQYALGNSFFNDASAVVSNGNSLWVHDAGANRFRRFDYSGGATVGGTELEQIATDEIGAVMEMTWVGDYIVAGTLDGELVIITDAPWVDAGSASPSMNGQGDEFTFSFSADTAGEYTIRLGATDNGGGQVVASGSIEAQADETVNLTVDGRYSEGDNLLRIVVDDGQNSGHDTVTVGVDNPPGTVTLNERSIGFGSEQLTLDFAGISDSDVSSYVIFISEESFTAADYPTGGPEFSAIPKSERTISAIPNEDYRVTLSPLQNGVRYYIGVRAYDEGGLESVMSNIVSAIPKETLSASELTGEEGGYCGSNLPMGWGLLSLASLAIVRRRRMWGGAALLLCGITPMNAEASALFTSEKEPVLRQSFDIRYGPIAFESQAINEVFTVNDHQILFADLGWSVYNILEVTAGAGFLQEMGWLLSEDGQRSTEHDMLTVYPLSFSGTFRLDVLKEQFVVPFGSYGFDYWMFKENWATGSGEEQVTGAKQGSHSAYGIHLLLDKLDPGSASKLEVRTGIRDSYLSIERRTIGFETDGLNFSSETTTVGLRFHY